jgi:hypothetical protein
MTKVTQISRDQENAKRKIEKYFVRSEVFTAVTMKNFRLVGYKNSSYLTGDTLRLGYRVQPVNVV